MTKNIEIKPEVVFARDKIEFKPIEINAYNKSIEEEKKLFSKDDFKTIYYDMCILRKFETILDKLKKEGSYNGISYDHRGPAHLSIGQESAAVGQAFTLDVTDHIYGSHRSHSEVLAKGLSAIRKLSDEKLMDIMENYMDGSILEVVGKNHNGSYKDLAKKFLIYGTYAENFARKTGFNKGLGGSMHVFFPPFGIYPNNAVVGASGSIGPGAALYKRINRAEGIVIINIGDGAFSCGPVWEGICISTMDQYRTLWDRKLGGGLPLIFNCMNNHYAMGGQTCGETMGFKILARLGAGVNPDQMHAERINGYDPLAVIDAIKRKKEVLRQGLGPVLLDTVTYRFVGHSPSDASSYRTREEIEMWEKADAIKTYRNKMISNNILTEGELEEIESETEDLVFEMFKLAVDIKISPRIDDKEYIGKVMFSNTKVERFSERAPEVNHPLNENPRVIQIRSKVRKGFDENGNPVPRMKAFNFRDGVFEAMMHRFYIDPTMVAFGEENRDWGGAFGVYRGMTEALPYHRLFNTPISEAGIVGAAVGYAIEGGRAVCELMYCDFLGRAGDEIFNQLSKWQSMSAGILKMPVVLRISVGTKYGAQHSQDWSSIVNHIPGLKIVYPVTPYDAKGLMNKALSECDPVIFFESQKIYDYPELFNENGVPEGYYEVDFGEPAIRKKGKDITIISLGPFLYTALEAAEILENNYRVSAEVIDLRSIVPMNYDLILESLNKTGKVLLGSEAVERGSYMHNVASNITKLAFDLLDAPPVVIGSRNWITPAPELEDIFFPQKEWVLDAIHENIMPLDKYIPGTNQSAAETKRRYKYGI
ncbi:MAG: thiamine pyrophosphate-dependent enzyme [Actinomycetota bacterium]|nr:thiamine pyrophosphate-dependent enzyme [Actinomycetota bacterium]